MKVLYLTPGDPRTTPLLWSGTALAILRATEACGHTVEVETIPHTKSEMVGDLKWHTYRTMGKQFLTDADPLVRGGWYRSLQKRLRGRAFDAVVSWHPWATLLVPGSCPRVFWYDTTFIETQPIYYPRVTASSYRRALALDREAVHTATAVYCSNASRLSAIRHYDADPARVHTVPFGANLSHVPSSDRIATAIETRVQRRAGRDLKLLFVGFDWRRKGGSVAIDVTEHLRSRNFNATLTVVGSTPELNDAQRSYVHLEGRLNKNDPADLQRLSELYLSADYFFMTSHGESFGIVYCEAMAHGVPSIAANVGGVGTIVRDGETGMLFDWSDDLATSIVERICREYDDDNAYRAMCERCVARYNDTFNWNAAGKHFDEILRNAVVSYAGGA